jgi:hypothetical protein
LLLTFRNQPLPAVTPESEKKVAVPSGYLAVKRQKVFVSRWQLRGADSKGHTRFLFSFDTVVENAMESA